MIFYVCIVLVLVLVLPSLDRALPLSVSPVSCRLASYMMMRFCCRGAVHFWTVQQQGDDSLGKRPKGGSGNSFPTIFPWMCVCGETSCSHSFISCYFCTLYDVSLFFAWCFELEVFLSFLFFYFPPWGSDVGWGRHFLLWTVECFADGGPFFADSCGSIWCMGVENVPIWKYFGIF